MASIIAIRAAPCGSLKYLLNNLVITPKPVKIALRALTRDNVVNKKEYIMFDADAHVYSVKETGRDTTTLLDIPINFSTYFTK